MKTLTTFFFLLVTLLSTRAQTAVDANEIMAKIDRKQAVSYQNVTITGDLDLTRLANRKEIRDGNWGDQEHYLSIVNVPLSFKNCTFSGKLLAYRTENRDGKILNTNNIVYNTDFTEAVTIEDCRFENDAAFKYSNFSQKAVFIGNTFQKEALFKYSKFHNAADFSGSAFRGYADFKYTVFSESSAFQQARFDRYADFKYTKFEERVDFQKATFSGNADFKYTNFPRGTKFDDTRFSGLTDFKYTTLDGQKFNPNKQR